MIDSFDLYDAGGQKIGRVEGHCGARGEPVLRIVAAKGQLVCQLSGGEVGRLDKLLAAMKAARR